MFNHLLCSEHLDGPNCGQENNLKLDPFAILYTFADHVFGHIQ